MTAPRLQLLTLVDLGRHAALWTVAGPRLSSVVALTELSWSPVAQDGRELLAGAPEWPGPGPCAVLATGSAAGAAYRLAGAVAETTWLVLVDPDPPDGLTPWPDAGVGLTVVGLHGPAVERVAPLLAWRSYAAGEFEIRVLPAAQAPGAVDLLTDHVIDGLRVWWGQTELPPVTPNGGSAMTEAAAIPESFERVLRRQCHFLEEDAPLPPEAPLAGLGLDSLGIVNLVVDIEDEFRVIIPEELMTDESFATAASLWAAMAGVVGTAGKAGEATTDGARLTG